MPACYHGFVIDYPVYLFMTQLVRTDLENVVRIYMEWRVRACGQGRANKAAPTRPRRTAVSHRSDPGPSARCNACHLFPSHGSAQMTGAMASTMARMACITYTLHYI